MARPVRSAQAHLWRDSSDQYGPVGSRGREILGFMDVYADTSFLFSYYLPDANTPNARDWLLAHSDPLPLTPFHRVELRNGISLAVFRRRITEAQAAAAWSGVEQDWQEGRLIPVTVNWSKVFSDAESIATTESPLLGTRSLDIIHVAIAKQVGAVDFLSFDVRQTALAKKAGLIVKP